jgi:FkbM family methyltransferase
VAGPIVDLARYVRAFGLTAGTRAFTAVHAFASGEAVVRVPGLSQPVTLRRNGSDRRVFNQIFVLREYDIARFRQFAAVKRCCEALLAEGRRPVIVDCGANIGLSALFLHSLWPTATVVAVEPERSNYELLRRNTAGVPAIVPIHAAIADRPGTVRITNPSAGSWAFRVEASDDASGDLVPAITIDEACARVPNGVPLVVKVDIEGAEQHLFSSNLDWLNRAEVVMVELHDWMRPWSGTTRPLFRALEPLDFDFVLNGENAVLFNWRLRAFAPPPAGG